MTTTAQPVTASFGQQEINDGVREIVMAALSVDKAEYNPASSFIDLGASSMTVGGGKGEPTDAVDIRMRANAMFGVEVTELNLRWSPEQLGLTVAGLLKATSRFRT
ncbi:MAG: hypothetical protein EYC62_08790 [Alphaproteobacteria bacterium]|nr:MAG: hypothetical protein EYC62_08790 [Alphaproteobacteria bacterium]